ncbi:uncharacterized protein LACBIDRAFT_295563 [Laccaria bicolor S238N-H82]|uniref:Predicted protein n=1 Tax=Laccaria bicolor (strain S238N-H82 / ATCC MYA-4686) TaxID=486041 RepID=B0DV25_LACBS|nr:uncharacterized protein LACBIDRAFT_295563 [Laccaria bicolor S238N-H82]EDR01503.1 predicted protein [Laccaria bicolor S238N-H82]|eukprot:XP_001887855.1 predicted protein [Laccaria bicolor S238N-H82]
MSASPQDTVPTNANTPTTTTTNASSNLQLSTLLTETYTENEALKKELTNTRKRVEKAERLLLALTDASSSSPSSESSAKRVFIEYEDRVQRAEIARDEAESRRRAVVENWAQFDRWLQMGDLRNQEARESFGRIYSVVGYTLNGSSTTTDISTTEETCYKDPNDPFSFFTTTSTTTPYYFNVPQSTHAKHRKRIHPPTIKTIPREWRTEDVLFRLADAINGIAANQQPPPPHMASLPLPSTTTSQNGSPHLRSHHSRRHAEEGSSSSRRVHVYQGQQAQEGVGYAYPANQSVPRKDVGLQQQPPGPLVQPGQVQQYQTHVFAPVVTGAPMKKPKYSVSGSSIGGGGSVGALAGVPGGPAGGPIDPPIVAPPPQVFPATNAQGQRICRQCGLPGRYKDNKCVEKWGPGPMGPGTVCDRCRKKMKRVERRGTLETQQQMAVMHQHQQQQQQQQPSRGGSISQLPLSQGSDRSIHRTDTVLTHHGSFSQPSQSQSQVLGREPSQPQLHAQTQAPPRSSHSHPSHTSHLRTPTITQVGGASPNRSPPPSIAAFEEDEGEEEDAEHEREQEHDGEDGDSEQLPLSNVGRGGKVGSRSRAGVKKNGATAAGGKDVVSGSGGRSTPTGGGRGTPAGGGGRSTPVVGGRSTPAGRSTPSGARRTTPANKKSPLGATISPTLGMEVDETDADADADAEAEAEAEILGAVEATGGGDQEMVDADGDAEAELLEAVDAAEANSSSSSSHGGPSGGGWMKEEDGA